MDENLVGYLLNALDPATHADVDAYLANHPAARRRLDACRRTLDVLALDRADPEPPPGLAARTEDFIAAYRSRSLPFAPKRPSNQAGGAPSWWRRSDLLVAAGILLCTGLLLLPGLNQLRHYSQVRECANNLRVFHNALAAYSDRGTPPRHPPEERGAFPNVVHHAPASRHVAGLFVPVLMDAGVLRREEANIRCPAKGPPLQCPWTLEELNALSDDKEYHRRAPQFSGCYAYPLGYREGDRIRSHHPGDGRLPLVADGPPPDEGLHCNPGLNSSNHRGRGQNILFGDGHVEFLSTRHHNGDDIYLNQDRQVAPGLKRGDTVLGASATRIGN
jgi:prepilin-type processing-associated H-X9-DG protein